jgi:hypothetical protein
MKDKVRKFSDSECYTPPEPFMFYLNGMFTLKFQDTEIYALEFYTFLVMITVWGNSRKIRVNMVKLMGTVFWNMTLFR